MLASLVRAPAMIGRHARFPAHVQTEQTGRSRTSSCPQLFLGHFGTSTIRTATLLAGNTANHPLGANAGDFDQVFDDQP